MIVTKFMTLMFFSVLYLILLIIRWIQGWRRRILNLPVDNTEMPLLTETQRYQQMMLDSLIPDRNMDTDEDEEPRAPRGQRANGGRRARRGRAN